MNPQAAEPIGSRAGCELTVTALPNIHGYSSRLGHLCMLYWFQELISPGLKAGLRGWTSPACRLMFPHYRGEFLSHTYRAVSPPRVRVYGFAHTR